MDETSGSILFEVVGDEVSKTNPITTHDGLESICKGFRTIGARLKSGDIARVAQVTGQDYEQLKTWLWGVAHIEVFDSKFNAGWLNIKGHLEMVANPQNRFGEDFQQLATYLIQKFGDQSWGVIEKEKTDKASPANAKKRISDLQTTDGTTTKKVKRASLKKDDIRRPPAEHKIFGDNGPMRGTLWYPSQSNSRPTTALDPEFPSKNAKVYGHNGLKVGDWYPRAIAALRDGAHGQRTAGVSGSLETGAFSIIMSSNGKGKGGYKGVDEDRGDTIIYSGTGGNDSNSTTADEARRGTKCLIKSLETQNPVRVIRGVTKWKGSPKAGYRYDGVYKVVEKGEGANAKSGVYTWFKLVRLENQDKINRKVPNYAQRRLEVQVSKGY